MIGLGLALLLAILFGCAAGPRFGVESTLVNIPKMSGVAPTAC
jgi:hypothetical protein